MRQAFFVGVMSFAIVASARAQDEEGFVPMFNGVDLSGWVNVNCAPNTFTLRDGMIVSTGVPTGVLRTERMYTNFIVELEWRHMKARGNAGFFAWSGAVPVCGQPFTKAIEVQIIDSEHPEGIATRHGDVFAIQGAMMTPDRPHPRGWMRSLPSEKRVKAQGEWNHYRVECRDGVISLAVNGKVVSGGNDCSPRRGYIVLESEGSECHFRNVRIKELPESAPVPKEHVAEKDEGYVSLYTGVNLAGWRMEKGHEGHWRPKDWILEYDGKSGASEKSLFTQGTYRDFSVILDWRHLKDEGSKKVPLILPGGMEVEAETDRALNQWSRAVVTVVGGRMTVKVNEKVVAEGREVKGVEGAIGLLHREHPMQFANVYVKDLTRVARADEGRRKVTVVEQVGRPLITQQTEGARENKYGFEGGRVVKVGETFHLFVSEMIADPKWAKTRLGHWKSSDRAVWERVSTLYESSGEYARKDPRAALFLPIPAFDETIGRWTMFYSAFRSAPNAGGKWLINHEGHIVRAVSTMEGREGIGGPYEDVNVALRPGEESEGWEGLQGTMSFFPYRAGEKWVAFYGSAQTQNWPCTFWGVGLVTAEKLAGPWKRMDGVNPVLMDKLWVENPHVVKLADGTFVAVFDATQRGRVLGYSFSKDGVKWEEARYMPLSGGEENWLKGPRTPVGLFERGDGAWDLFFTGNSQNGWATLGRVGVRIE